MEDYVTSKELFDPEKFYESYPAKVMLRPGYPTRAQFKSTLMWNLFGEYSQAWWSTGADS